MPRFPEFSRRHFMTSVAAVAGSTLLPKALMASPMQDPVVNTTQKVAVIQKGQTQTVTFKNLNLPPKAFGNNATVTSIIGRVPGETNLTDNHASYPVFFSLPSG